MLSTAAIRRVFEGDRTAPEPLDKAVEVELIAEAKKGDTLAFTRLLDAYTPGLRALAAKETRRTSGLVEVDETRANVLAGFVEAVHAAREGERVAPQLDPATRKVADVHNLVGALSVPDRMRRFYFQAVRAAARNGTDAVDEFTALGKGRETFYAIRQALTFDSIERIVEGWNTPEHYGSYYSPSLGGASDREPGMSAIYIEPGYASVEDKALVAAAFAAIAADTLTVDIIRDAYGFNDYEPVPDAEIAHRRATSRQTVQRKRTTGLATMHGAVCDGHDDPRCQREHD